MKKKKSILFLSVLALFATMPALLAGEAAKAVEEVPSFVRFITTIFGQEPGDPSTFFLFLGRFHPIVLHLPIGMLVVAFFMQAFALWKKRDDFRFPYCFCLGCSFVFSVLAVLLGSFLAMSNDYNPDLINRHGWGGMLFTFLVGLAFILKYSFIRSGHEKIAHKKASLVVMFLALNVMSLVGHDGGSLTHGEEYLFKYAPNPVRVFFGFDPLPDPENEDSAVFLSVVQPFLKNNCTSCHGSSKMKGGLRLDTIEMIKKGGKNEKLIVHGKASDSLFYQLMLTSDEDEIMPPKGMLAKPYLELIKFWINSSKTDADLYEKTIADSGISDELRYINIKKKIKVPAHAVTTKSGAAEKAVEPIKEAIVPEVKTVVQEVKAVVPEVKAASGGVDFMKDIAPIFEALCVKCHGEKKQKGEYRLDKAEFAFIPGDSEEAPITKGHAAKSYLLTLVKMSEDEDEVMPPKGDLLTAEQITKVEAWINAGAEIPAEAALQDKSKKKKKKK